jgi:hypothetical protein
MESGVPVKRRRFFLPTPFAVLPLLPAWCVLLAGGSAAAAEPTKQECVAANESAQDLRHAGKLREARARLAVCTAATCPSAVREDCGQRLKEVEAAQPTVVFAAKDNEGHDLSAVKVTMDGGPLLDKLDGSATVVDPGEHHFAFEADGFRVTENMLVIREGDVDRSVKIVLQSLTAPAAADQATPSSSDGSTWRSIGLALGASGAAGLVVGGIFSLVGKFGYDHAKSECIGGDPAKGCGPQAQQDRQTANGQETVATIASVGGGVLLAAGAVLFFTAPKAAASVTVGATVANGGGGLSLRGRW